MYIKGNRFIYTSLMFVLLVICVLFSHINIFSYIALFVYIAYWMYLYHFEKTYFVKYLSFIFVSVGVVVGTFIIELFPKQYLYELRCQSHFSGSLPLLIFSYWIFLYVLELREYCYRKVLKIRVEFFNNIKGKKVINIFAAISGSLLLVLFLYVATHTLPSFLLKIDRIAFGQIYKMPWIISKLRSIIYLLLFFPLLALIYANRLIGIISIILYCAFNFWIGEKFGSFFTLLCVFFIIFYNKSVFMDQSRLKRILWCGIIIFLTLLFLASFIMVSAHGNAPFNYFYQRTAEQGQLWWKTYDLYKGTVHPAEFVNEISAFIEGDKSIQESVGEQNGIYKIMYLCAPANVVSSVLAGGVRYSQADYAVMYYYFGIFGVIIYSVLMGIIVSRIVNSFILAINKNEYIKALIYLRFLNMIRSSFCMFTFGEFIDIFSILSYVYLIFAHGRCLQFGSHRNVKSYAEIGEINTK